MKNIIWPIDPFSIEGGTLDLIKQEIKNFGFDQSGYQLQLIYILNLSTVNWVGYVNEPNPEKYLEPALNKLESLEDELNLSNMKAPKVLVSDSHSTKRSCELFRDYCKEHQVDQVIISTSNKSAIERFFVGSFTEELLNKIDADILVVTPGGASNTESKRVLFPTDLTEASLSALNKYMTEQKAPSEHIVLYHKSIYAVDSFLQASAAAIGAGGGWVSVERDMDDLQQEVEKKLQSIVQELGTEKASYIIDQSSGSISESVIKAQKENNCQYIALNAQSSELEAKVLGSVSRNIIRGAQSPIWIIS